MKKKQLDESTSIWREPGQDILYAECNVEFSKERIKAKVTIKIPMKDIMELFRDDEK